MKIIEIPEHLLPDPSKLEMLADVLDLQDKNSPDASDEVQKDLRTWASNLREFGVNGRYNKRHKRRRR